MAGIAEIETYDSRRGLTESGLASQAPQRLTARSPGFFRPVLPLARMSFVGTSAANWRNSAVRRLEHRVRSTGPQFRNALQSPMSC